MPDVIQFNCPACDTALSLPLALAAVQGPCPRCGRRIVAPDPGNGIDARMASEPPVPGASATSARIEGTPAATPEKTPREQATATVSPEDSRPVTRQSGEAPRPASQAAVLMLSVFLTGTLCLVAGYLLGARSIKTPAPAPSLVAIPAHDEEPVKTPTEPAPAQRADNQPEWIDKAAKASSAAEAALRAFLNAPDWKSRSAYVLDSEKLMADMEAYSHMVPDGPTPYTSIAVRNSYTDPVTDNTLFIYQVVTDQHPEGFPVAVSEATDAWLVDWQAFVEFRDDQFASFSDGPAGVSGNFHLLVTAPPAERAQNTENIHFSSFIIEAPLPDRQRLAYVRKSSKIHAGLTAATANGAVFTPILEVTKQKTPDDRTFLEITGILDTDWLPDGM